MWKKAVWVAVSRKYGKGGEYQKPERIVLF